MAAGPWPDLAVHSLFWRAPLAAAGLIIAWRKLPRRAGWVTVVVLAALALDATVPAARSAAEFAARANAKSTELQRRLAGLADESRLHGFLYPGGREAEPEAPFPLVQDAMKSLPFPLDCLVLVDDHGLPVAWTGHRARLPVRLRTLGDRTVVAEPSVGSVWLWWREPVFEGGRPLGALLAGVEIPEAGSRRVLGVWVGRAAMVAPRLGAGDAGSPPGPARVVGFDVRHAQPVVWSVPAGAVFAALAVLAVGVSPTGTWLLLGATLGLLPALGWLGRAWWLVVGLAGGGVAIVRLPRGVLGRTVAAGSVGLLAWALPGLFDLLGLDPLPERLLWPGVLRWATVAALAILLRNAGRRSRPLPWPLRLASWAFFAFAVMQANPPLLGAAAALVTFVALPARGLILPAIVAASLLVGSTDAARRTNLVAATESTLARLERVEAPARALLASLPEQAVIGMVSLEPGERLVVLGRLATWMNLSQTLPGTSLALANPRGERAGVWGETPVLADEPSREVAARALRNGWQIAILEPPSPLDLLEGLNAAGVDVPVAVFDRSGGPTSRGAMFRPLSPLLVGRALADGRSWGRVGVGEREFAAYFHARHDAVLVVPWVRPPLAEEGLLIAALTLWGVFPLTVWERRRRWRTWWGQRRTFAGRVRLLAVATTVLPVLLLGQFVPQQWSRQREKARLEFGRGLSQLLATTRGEEGLSWLVREMGATVAVYRAGRLMSATRLDLAVLGRVPGLPPAEAYVRSVRGWREPVVLSGEETDVFAPLREGEEPVVVGVVGLQLEALGRSSLPGEWFVVTGIFAMVVALGTAERLGQRLARPLRRLVGAARRLEQGQRVVQVETGGDEDVQALGRAFLTMAREVQRREEDLRSERDLLERVLATLSAAVVVADATGKVELANAAARALLASDQRLTGLAARFSPRIAALLARASSGERVEETVHPVRSPESLWRVTVVPLPGQAGRVLVVMEDLSELARAQRLSSLAELARIAAHEVKNPLTPIRLWAEELKVALERGPEEVVRVALMAAPQIIERVEHLKEVAQGFSNLVTLERWEPRVLALHELAREVVAEYDVLGQRGIAVRLSADEAEVVADPLWLRRALRHLLENSARVLAGQTGEIVVTVQRTPTVVVLSVRDTGGGVPDELLGRLFEPHFSTTSEGSGLGLAVVQRVATRADGNVEARNVGGGLEVRLIFPLR